MGIAHRPVDNTRHPPRRCPWSRWPRRPAPAPNPSTYRPPARCRRAWEWSYNFQASSPVVALYAATNPRIPLSPPLTPVTTRSPTTSGAAVPPYCPAAPSVRVHVPQQRAGQAVQRDQVRVIGEIEDAVAQHRNAAIHANGRVSADLRRRALGALDSARSPAPSFRSWRRPGCCRSQTSLHPPQPASSPGR